MNAPETQPAYWRDFPEITEQTQVAWTTVTAADGAELRVYRAGEPAGECFVLIMPTSTPSLLMLRTATRLARHLPVVSWEPRGATFLPGDLDSTRVTVDRHVQDLHDVVCALGVTAIHLVAWCSSADTAAHVVARSSVNVLSVAVIAPTLTFLEQKPSPFRQLFIPMLNALADGVEEKEAERICRSIRTLTLLRVPRDDDDALVHRLTFMNFSCSKNIRRYAVLTRAFHRVPPPKQRRVTFQEMCESVPTFMLCFEDDEVVGGQLPERLGGGMSRLVTEVHPKGGHFAPFKQPERVCSSLIRFFRSHGIGAARSVS